MDAASITNLQSTLTGYVTTTSGLVVTVGLAIIGLAFTVKLLKAGRSAASGGIRA